MNNIVFLNGKFLSSNKASVSLFDRGFLYGDGIFETMQSYDGTIFALDTHLERLNKGAKTIGIPFGHNKKYLHDCLKKLLELNNLMSGNAYIKLIITRGLDYRRLLPSRALKHTIAIIAKPLDAKMKYYRQRGMSAIFLPYKRSFPDVKSLNLLPNIMGLLEAGEKKAQEGIFTAGSKILEGSIANIFLSDGKRLKTPPVKDGILPGITRKIVIELAKRDGIKTAEISLTKTELMNAKEAFLTNSIMEIAPLVKIENKIIGNGKTGSITGQLQRAYRELTLCKSGLRANLLFCNK